MSSLKVRLSILLAVLLVVSTALVMKAARVQIIGDERLEKLAKRQFQSRMLVRPRRGLIVDRQGEPLAINVQTHSLAANPLKIPDRRIAARRISSALGLDFNQIIKKLKSDREFVWIKRDLGEVKLSQLEKWGLAGTGTELDEAFWLVREEKRVYPHGSVASQVVGTTNIDGEGIEGVELWKNDELRGKIASVRAVRDALGRPAFLDVADVQESKDGGNIQLTIDASLQFGVEELVKKSVLQTHSRSGLVLVMDSLTGEILVMAQYPSFDPNQRTRNSEHRRNRALTDGYEPGSTMKPFLLAEALTQKRKLTDQIWGGRGEVIIQGKKISEAETHERFEWLTLEDMVALSSNVVSAKLAIDLGAQKLIPFLRNLGFGGKSGIEFMGEITGNLPSEKKMSPLTLANIGFGQGMVVSPVQLIRAYGAIANGGLLPTPRLTTDLPGSKQSPKIGSAEPPRVLSTDVVENTIRALRQVVVKGTGKAASLPGYTVVGKTGTAQTVDPRTRRYSRSHYIPSFVGFPLSPGAKPLPVIMTWLDGPEGAYYASETAVPLFRDVLDLVVNRFGIPKEESLFIEPERPDPVLALKELEEEAPPKFVNKEGVWEVPSLMGLTPREALRSLEGKSLEARVSGFGVVRSQHPKPGMMIREGETVRLELGE